MSTFLTIEDYGFLKETELTSIFIGEGGVQFRFDKGQNINVNTGFEHYDAATGETHRYTINGRVGEFTVQRLLGQKTKDVIPESEDRLAILFESGDRLILLRFYEYVESMTILGPKGDPYYVIE